LASPVASKRCCAAEGFETLRIIAAPIKLRNSIVITGT
jgi:hypothetical protein